MKKELPLRERLRKYLAARPREWVSSGSLQRLTMEHANQTARTAVRRLQEMAEDGVLDRELRKGHTWYKIKQQTPTHNPIQCEACIENKQLVASFV